MVKQNILHCIQIADLKLHNIYMADGRKENFQFLNQWIWWNVIEKSVLSHNVNNRYNNLWAKSKTKDGYIKSKVKYFKIRFTDLRKASVSFSAFESRENTLPKTGTAVNRGHLDLEQWSWFYSLKTDTRSSNNMFE